MRWIQILILIFFQAHLTAQDIKLTQPVRFLALGDSYTIGQSVETSERWPVQLKVALQNRGTVVSELNIIAQTGWRTDNLIDAIKYQKPDSGYNLVSLLIGVNNQFQRADFETYVMEFEQLLQTAIKLAGDVKESVFVVSIPDYGYTPFGYDYQEFISVEIDKYNHANKQIAAKYGVAYINITPISREGIEKPEYVAGDGLHPSGEMYAEWVTLIMKGLGFGSSTRSVIVQDETSLGMVLDTNEKKIVFKSAQPVNKNTVFQIIDLSGKLHLSGKLLENEIDISGLDRGVYLFRLAGIEIITQKFFLSE